MKKSLLLPLFLNAAARAAAMIAVNLHAAAGDLYQSDLGSGTVFKFTPAGSQSTFAASFNTPIGIVFDRAGTLYVAETGSGSILKITPDGTQSTFASGLTGGPTALAFDAHNNLFVGEFNSGTIFKLTTAGAQTTFASGLTNPTGLAFDRSGNLFVADLGPGTIFKFGPTGTKSTFASGAGNPGGLAFDRAGDLFVADNTGNAILKFTPAGTKTTFASGLNGPAGLAFDTLGNLFVADQMDGMIFKFTPVGSRSTFASGLNGPTFLAFEPVTEKLQNISARGLVQTGENVLIAGFIVGGNTLIDNAVVVRALGPTLSSFGVTNPLQNPKIELHDASGTIIASNDNWQDTQAVEIRASGLAPARPNESAIAIALPTGNYTVVVRGVGDTTGIALAEVYSQR